MDINAATSPISQLISFTSQQVEDLIKTDDLQISFFVIKKQKNANNYYHSQQLALAEEVRLWLASHIISQLNVFKEDGDGEFIVSSYNFEFQKNASLAKLNLLDVSTLDTKYNDLKSSLDTNELLAWQRSNFQIVRIIFNQKTIYFAFYRAPRKTTNKKKYVIFNTNEWELRKEPEIELGGALDFFVLDNFIFINNLRNFEYTFDYSDHIKQQMEANLNVITSLNLFQGDYSNKEQFIEQSSKYIYSRALAQISRQTLSALDNNFEERCNDLQQIKQTYDSSNDADKIILKEQFKEIWPLFDFIDLDNKQIIYNEQQKPITLIHFFADKIVRSFLTNEFKVAATYESVL